MSSRRTDPLGLKQIKGRTDVRVDAHERPAQRGCDIRSDDPHHSCEIRSTATTSQPTVNHTDRDSADVVLWLRRADQLLLGFLLIALLILLVAFRWKLSGGGRTEIEIVSQQPREYFYSVDINTASWVEWAQLDGIGETLAKRIVKNREDKGPFSEVDDIRRVRGFGPKLVEKLRRFLKCANTQDLQADTGPIGTK